MSVHPREHQDFVDRVFGGELDEGEASVRARLEACGECREELQRLRELDAGLRTAAREAREHVELARSQVVASDEALVRDTLRAAMSRRGFGSEGSSARLRLFALAAGLLLLLGLGTFVYLHSGREPAEILLQGGSIRCTTPVEAVDDYDEFAWSGNFPVQASFVLHIHVLDGDEAGDELRTVDCPEPRWTPTPEEKRALPDGIYWRVEARDVTGALVDRGSAKAWRRSSRSR